MEEIYRKARAKINLSLDVVGKREDNYHNIESIFQKINLYDELYISKTQTNGIEIKTNVEELSSQDNIIYKAYQLLKERYKEITGVQVRLKKKIPMQAGLAGGSTDCASFLLGMNQLFHLKLSKAEIEKIGKSLGADVVPCFYNKALLAEGIGDIIQPINTHFKYYFVIIKPEISFNTKQMYQKVDEQRNMKQSNNSNKIKEALEQNQLEIVANHLYNVFEEVIEEKELIQTIKEELMQEGAVRKFNDRFRFLCVWNI